MRKTMCNQRNTPLALFFVKAVCRDWRLVAVRLAQQGFTPKEIIISVLKYCCFLSLTYVCSDMLIPSVRVDLVHHALLEEPVQYRRAMKRLGHHVEHEVYDDVVKREQHFIKTQRKFYEVFGFSLLSNQENGEPTPQSGGCYLKKAPSDDNGLIQLDLGDIELNA